MATIQEQTEIVMSRVRAAVTRSQRGKIQVRRDKQGKIIHSGGQTAIQADDAKRHEVGDNWPGDC